MIAAVTGDEKTDNIQVWLPPLFGGRLAKRLNVSFTKSLIAGVTRTRAATLPLFGAARSHLAAMASFGAVIQYQESHNDVYNVLWAIVFGFATLNILNLAARRFEPTRRGMSFGELLAVMVVLLSVFMLGWEMLNLFHVFPLRLRR